MKKKMAQNIHLVTTIVAIMAILKIKYIWILLEHNCCNYGNSETKQIQLTPDDNCCNCGNCGKKKTNMNPGDNNCRNYGNSEKSW